MPSKTASYLPTGQVFTETVVPAKPKFTSWHTSARGSPHEHLTYTSESGASSLRAIATRSFLTQSRDVTASTIEGLTWPIAKGLWRALVLNQLDSVRIWQAFVTAFWHEPGVKTGLGSRTKCIAYPKNPLELYFKPLQSESFAWLTVLTLQNIRIERSAMIHGLSKLRNLMCLTLGEGLSSDFATGVDDHIVKAWARHAAEHIDISANDDDDAADSDSEDVVGSERRRCTGRPFGMLRVINMRLQPDLTSRCFDYLAVLPSLSIINVNSCGVGHADAESAEEAGWSLWDFDDVPHPIYQIVREKTGWNALINASLEHTREIEKAEDHLRSVYSLPRLHLMLGDDETQSLRTVRGLHASQGVRIFSRNPGLQVSKKMRDVGTRLVSGGAKVAKKRRSFKGPSPQDVDNLWSEIGFPY